MSELRLTTMELSECTAADVETRDQRIQTKLLRKVADQRRTIYLLASAAIRSMRSRPRRRRTMRRADSIGGSVVASLLLVGGVLSAASTDAPPRRSPRQQMHVCFERGPGSKPLPSTVFWTQEDITAEVPSASLALSIQHAAEDTMIDAGDLDGFVAAHFLRFAPPKIEPVWSPRTRPGSWGGPQRPRPVPPPDTGGGMICSCAMAQFDSSKRFTGCLSDGCDGCRICRMP